MPEIKKCQTCGVAIASNAPLGNCPRCLLALGFGPVSKELPKLIDGSEIGRLRYFGDYELLEEIARGGMGTVFKARQTSLNRLVAIKLISAGALATEELVKRFKAEAESTASLAHPNIVPIFEIGQHEGHHYFSMGFIEGPNLREALSAHTSPPETARASTRTTDRTSRQSEPPHQSSYEPQKAAQLLVALARAVHYAHRRGVLHRDIKPSNVLLDANGTPHLTDFGLAKFIEDGSTLTHTNEVIGTPAYMSPEQALGKSRDVTTATDVYGLGAVLYETLTGSPPFSGDTSIETLRRVIDREPRAPSILNPKVDRDLETICLKCLSKEPEGRYVSAVALAEDLEHWLRDEPILARRVSLLERATKWANRQPVLAACVVLLLVVLFLGTCGVLWQWRRAEYANRQTTQSNDHLRRALNQMDSIQLQRAEEYIAEDSRAEAMSRWALLLRTNPSNRLAAERLMSSLSHRTWARLSCPPMEHSNRLTFAWFSLDGRLVVTSAADNTASVWSSDTGRRVAGPLFHAAEINTAIFSWDGKWVVTASKDKTARIWNVETGAQVGEPLQHDADVTSAQFSPDGKMVLTTRGHLALLWSAETGQRIGATLEGGNYIYDVRFNPTGDRVALASHNGESQLWDVASGVCLHRFKHESSVYTVAFSPDGSKLVTTSRDKTARVWNVQSGQPLGEALQHADAVIGAEFSPDSQRIVTASRDQTAQIWDAQTGQKIGSPLKHKDVVRMAMFSPDGLRVVTASWDKTARVWDALSGQPLTEPLIHGDRLFFAGFFPDGERILTAANGNSALIWQVIGTPALTIRFKNDVGSVEFNLGDNQIVIASDGSDTRVWDPWTGRPLTPPLVHTTNRRVNYAVFSRDGRRVATASEDGTARIWNSGDGEPVTKPLEHEGEVYHAEFNSAGTKLLTCSPYKSVVWEAEGQHTKVTFVHEAPRSSAGFSPDGESLVTFSQTSGAQVWNTYTGKPVTPAMVHAEKMTSARFSPDGRSILTTAQDAAFFIWDAQTGRRSSGGYLHRQWIEHAVYSPNGKYVLTSTKVYGAQIWDLQSGSSIVGEFGMRDFINNADFVPDGSKVMIVYADGSLQLWNPFSGRRSSEVLPHNQGIKWKACSADGRLIAVSSSGKKVTIWEIPEAVLPVPDWLPELAEGLAGQRFDLEGQLVRVRPAELWATQEKMEAFSRAATSGATHALKPGTLSGGNGTRTRADSSATTAQGDLASVVPLFPAARIRHADGRDYYARWAEWFIADTSTRTVLPSSPLTLPEYAARLIQQNTFESAAEALRLQPTNTLVMSVLADACIGRREQTNGYAVWLKKRATALGP
jgi:WD40 repeat protein